MDNPVSLKNIVVVIGMPRAGTTWLYENLKAHPDICASEYKEINRYLCSMNDEQYLNYFENCNGRLMLDVSPLYFFDLKALGKIAENHEKSILIVREADEWIQSLQMQIEKYGGDVPRMMETQQYILPIEGSLSITFDHSAYCHAEYISKISKIFGDKLLVVDFDTLQHSPLDTLKKVERYLGIKPHFEIRNSFLGKINSSKSKISPLYVLLLKIKLLHRLMPLILKILPKSMVHWLRRHFVYGD